VQNRGVHQKIGTDGNAFAILYAVKNSLIKAGQAHKVDSFMKEAKSGDYDHLLQTVHKYVEVR